MINVHSKKLLSNEPKPIDMLRHYSTFLVLALIHVSIVKCLVIRNVVLDIGLNIGKHVARLNLSEKYVALPAISMDGII